MRRSADRRSPRALAHSWVRVLLALLVGVAALQAVQKPHLHRAGHAVLFNEEHVLAALDSVTADAPLPDPAPAVRADPSSEAGPIAISLGISGSAARCSVPRAPPLA